MADEAWVNHRKRNESRVAELFQGQFRSRIVCPECSHDSVKFDTFNHITLPLPVKMKLFVCRMICAGSPSTESPSALFQAMLRWSRSTSALRRR